MKTVEKMIDSLIRQSCEIMVTLKKLRETDYTNDLKEFENQSDRLTMLSEKYCCSVRDFSHLTYCATDYEIMDKAAEVMGIEVYKSDKAVTIDIPQLLPRKKGKNNKYLCEPLRAKLDEMSKSVDLKIREKAVIIITHIYNDKRQTARCYDYDNLESKKVIDVVALYTLTDDAPQYCDVYQTVKFGSVDKTQIIVMPKQSFREYVLSDIF